MTFNILYLVETKYHVNQIKKSLEKENSFLNLFSKEYDNQQNIDLLKFVKINNFPNEIFNNLLKRMENCINNINHLNKKVDINCIFNFDISTSLKKKDIKEYDSLLDFNESLANYFKIFKIKKEINSNDVNDNNVNDEFEVDEFDIEDEFDENKLVDESNHNNFPKDLPLTIIIVIDKKYKEKLLDLLIKEKINNKIIFETSFETPPSFLYIKTIIL